MQCNADSKDIIGRNSMFFTLVPDVLLRLVAIERFAHVKGVLTFAHVLAGGVVGIVVDDAAEDAVAHVAVHGDGGLVAGADVEVDEPGVGLVAGALELLGEEARVAEAPVLRSDGENGDVAVPGEGMWGLRKVWRRGFEFAHYCRQTQRVRTTAEGCDGTRTKGRYCSLLSCRVPRCTERARAIS
jgi:hypothetical protein